LVIYCLPKFVLSISASSPPLHPRSTLFPYTTLFRSNCMILYEDNHLLVVEKEPNVPVQADESKDRDLLTIWKEDIKERYNKPGKDRKSTRLNSSHVSISYAVFCLKKKKNKQQVTKRT